MKHLDETKLDKFEAILFINCLKDELARHVEAKKSAEWTAYLHHDNNVMKTFYELQVINHLTDIDMIKKSINYLVKKWGLI